MSLARKLELREQYVALNAPAPAVPRLPGRGLLTGPTPQLALPAPLGRAASAPLAIEGRPVRRLSQAEMEERRRQGLCFNCNEKFDRGHNRVCKRIFLLDLAEDDEEVHPEQKDTAADSPLISLLAMAGVRTTETMQVSIQLGGASLLALLDSGSTHNFIFEEATTRTSLKLQPRGNMVTMANSERVPCPGVYRTIPFSIDGEQFSTDFFAPPLPGYDVVLGTEWLASLGPIL